MSRSSRGVISMRDIVDPEARALVNRCSEDPGRTMQPGEHDLDRDEHHDEREVEHACGRDDPPDRCENRLSELQEHV